MTQRKYIVGLNAPGIGAGAEAWVTSHPVSMRVRVVSLVIAQTIAPYFDVLGGRVGIAEDSSPFVSDDPVTAFLFFGADGGSFELPVAMIGQPLSLRVRNIDDGYPHHFRGAFLVVKADEP